MTLSHVGQSAGGDRGGCKMMASGDEKELHTLERASSREVFKPKKCTAGNERPGVLATCAKMLYKK